MKKKYVVTSVFLILFFTYGSQAQTTWETFFAKSDKQFFKGKYAKSIKLNKKLRKKINKKPEDNAPCLAWLAIHEARSLEAKAAYPAMNQKITQGLQELEEVKANHPEIYIAGICKVADIYLALKNYKKANELLQNLLVELKQKNYEDNFLDAEIQQRILFATLHTGQLTKVFQKLPELIEHWKKASSTVGQASLSKYDIAYRNAQYGKLLLMAGEAYRLRGAYTQADSVFQKHLTQIPKLSSYYPVYTHYLIAQGDNYFDQNQYTEAGKYYEKALKSSSKRSRNSLMAREKVIRSYIMNDKEKATIKGLQGWSATTGKYFDRRGTYRIQEDILGAEWDIVNNKKQRARDDLEELLANDETILPPLHPVRLQALELLYRLNISDATHAEAAKENIETSLQVKKQIFGEESPNYQSSMVRLADYYLHYTDDFKRAKEILQGDAHTIVFKERSDYHKEFVELSNIVADYYEVIDQYEEALRLLGKGLKVLREKFGENHVKVGDQLVRKAAMQLKVGAYKDAEENMQIALKIVRKKYRKRSEKYADALASMAKIYGVMGLYSEAEKLLRNSSRIYQKLGTEDTKKAASIEEMAFLYIRIGEYAETDRLLNEILISKSEKYGDFSHHLITPLGQLGLLYLIQGDYKNAETYIVRASEIAKKVYGSKSLKSAGTYTLLARYYTTIGDYELAQEFTEKVIEIQKKQLGDKHVELGKSYMNIALIKFYRDRNNVKESEELLEKAKNIMAHSFDTQHPLYAEVLKNIGIIYVETTRYSQAFGFLQEANNIWLHKLGDRNINSAETYSLIGDVYGHLKRFREARENYKNAETIYKKELSKEHPDYIRTESKLGRMFFISGEYKDANRILDKTTAAYLRFIKVYFPALNEREKAKFWNKIKTDFEFFNSLAVKQAEDRPQLIEKMYNFRLATKALLLNSSIKVRQSIMNGNNPELKEIFSNWVHKKEELTNLLSMSEAQLTASEIDPDILRFEINNLEKTLSERSTLFANNLKEKVYTWKDVKNTLKDHEAVVEIIRYRNYETGFTDQVYYAALVVTPETRKTPELILFKNGKEMETKYLKYYRNMIKFRKKDRYSYKKYWKPIEEKVAGYQTIYLSPDGVYNQVNIESFLIQGSTYVIDKNNIRLISNPKDLILHQKKSNKKQTNVAVLFGNPVFYVEKEKNTSHSISQLPGTAAEVESIQQMLREKGWQVNLYEQLKAGEKALKEIQSPRVFHIATHGFFQESEEDKSIEIQTAMQRLQNDPLRKSGLLAKGAGDLLAKTKTNFDSEEGILTAYEAMNLNFDHTELVVLSACETGQGEVAIGEGVYGLQRSFLVAGADALIMSLFKVNDDITRELMITFYAKWLELGNKRQAFNQAQKTIKERYKYPLYWGAFNMIGVD